MSLNKQFMKILSTIDFFGKPVNIRIKKKETYNSLFGTIISLFIVAFVIYTFIDMVNDLFS